MGKKAKDRRSGAWAKVKAGDRIAWKSKVGEWHTSVVTRVTPSGIVVDDKSQRWHPSGACGSQRVLHGWVWAYPAACKVQELSDTWANEKCLSLMRRANAALDAFKDAPSSSTLEALEAIVVQMEGLANDQDD